MRVERLLLDGKGLVESSLRAEPNRLPLCVADRPVAKNAEVELAFVPRQGGIARSAGIVLRYFDPQDFYLTEADANVGRARLVRIVNGEHHEIAAGAATLVADKAHVLKVSAVDDSFTVSLNGKVVLQARDGAIATPGRFGIASRADSRTIFGDLFIAILD